MAFNAQKTTTTGLAAGMQTWCDRIMLLRGKDELVHAAGAVKKNIPRKSGKIAQFRRYTPLPIISTALTEAEIPDGQNFYEEQVLAYVYQYGAYLTKSDLLDLTHMDSDNQDLVELLADQGNRSIDALIRDEMATTTTTQYANSRTSLYTLRTTDTLTVDEVRKMVRTLKKNLTPQFKSGGKAYYLAIIGADTEYDIMNDSKWLNVATYQDKEKIYAGEIGTLYRVRFLMSTQPMTYENDDLVDGQVYLTAASLSTLTVTVDEAITADEATALVGRYLNCYDTSGTAWATARVSITAAAAGAAGSATITLSASPGFTIADGDVLYANEYGYNGNPVYGTFVFGDKAYATADIAGSGRMRTIITPKEVIGGPLQQFATIGWKVDAFAVKLLQPLWIGQIYHGATG